MSEPVLHPVGRFNARIVPAPHPLYHGGRRDFSRPRHDYERGIIIEVYDAAYDHSPAGQFISAYAATTLAEFTPGSCLNLHGGVPEWTMTREETATLVALARAASA